MISPFDIPEATSETVNSGTRDVRLETANTGESLFVLVTDPVQAGEVTISFAHSMPYSPLRDIGSDSTCLHASSPL